MTHERPRHIRDIAHIYLSRMTTGTRAPVRQKLLVCGADHNCFPGYHVANLALALSVQGRSVRVVDQSALILNAAYFLAMPPRVYGSVLDDPTSALPGWLSTVGGVTLCIGAPPDVEPLDEQPAENGIDVVHVPPASNATALVEALANIDDQFDALFIRPGGAPQALPHALGEAHKRMVLRLDTTGPARADDGVIDAGTVNRWRAMLPDVVPALIRDPASSLSRSYVAASRVVSGKTESKPKVENARPQTNVRARVARTDRAYPGASFRRASGSKRR